MQAIARLIGPQRTPLIGFLFVWMIAGFSCGHPAEAGTCGDGVLDVAELCDDGNAVDGDCCSSNCTLSCDDSDICTTDGCDGGVVCSHVPVACDDRNPCTSDACVAGVGCRSETRACDDENACTADSCDATSGECRHEDFVCTDDDLCTADACEPASGCVFSRTAACSQKSYESCQSAVIGAAAASAAAEMKAMAFCEDRRLAGLLAPELDCSFDPTTAAAIAKSNSRVEATIAKSCSDPAQLGWPSICPDFEGLGCGNIAIADAAGLASCLLCIQHGAVAQATGLYFGGSASADAKSSAAVACRKSIGKATSRYFTSRVKAYSRCYAGFLAGTHHNACPLPGDAKSAALLRKSEARMIGRISKDCAAVGTGQLGFDELCPAVGDCGGAVHSMMELIECMECVSAFNSGCFMNATMMPRQPVSEDCLRLVAAPCDDALDCTLDELVGFTEVSETTEVCYGGDRDGQACESEDDCNGGTCGDSSGGQARVCVDGANSGAPCATGADCPDGGCSFVPTACCQSGLCTRGDVGRQCTAEADCGCAGPQLEQTQECTHTPKTGAEYGDWLWLCTGGDKAGHQCTSSNDCDGGGTCTNASPCCEEDSDCEYPEPDPDSGLPDPCVLGTCARATHRCVFEEMHPSECADVDLPGLVLPAPIAPCTEPAPAGVMCDLTATVDPPPVVNLARFSGKPHFADLHLHMFAEESWVAKTWPFGTWRWVHDTVGTTTSSSDSCDGGGSHGRVRTLEPLLEKFEDCTIPFADTPIGDFLIDAVCSSSQCAEWRLLVETLGPEIFSEKMSKTEGTDGDTGNHSKRRHPGSGWPRWDTVAHHKIKAASLKSAKNRGLKLIVVMVTGTRGLCELLPPYGLPFEQDSCNEMDAVDRQIDAAVQFTNDNSGWIRLVRTPEEAEATINAGKMAMVLSIETTELFGDLESTIRSATSNSMMDQAIRSKLRQYYDKGIRSLHIAHMTDSLFAGAAESSFAGGLIEFMHEPYGHDCRATLFGTKLELGFDVTREYDDYAQGLILKNKVGLRPAGEILVDEMMNLGMLIDLSHTSEKTIQRVWELAYAGLPAKPGRTNSGPYYPFHFSHVRFREMVTPKESVEYTPPPWVMQRVRRVGGMVGLRTNGDEMRPYLREPVVENNCQGSSRSFAQYFRYSVEGLKMPTAFGSDMMTLGQYPRPRFRDNNLPGKPRVNRNGACAAGFRAEGICEARTQENARDATKDYDTLGLASIDQEMDLIDDLREDGVAETQLQKLESSSEDFIRMWKRATSVRMGPAALANVGTGPNDLDTGFIGPYTPVKQREKDYKLHIPCFRRYCEHTQPLGGECLFNEECNDPLLCGGPNLCGLNYGVCVCSHEGGCNDDEWCKLGLPLATFDNRCVAKKDNDESCHADRQCKSGKCKWFRCQD